MKYFKYLKLGSVFLTILISQTILIQLVSAQEGEVTLNPTDDSYTNSSSPGSNYGGQSWLEVQRYEFYEEIDEEIAWLKFNLSDVPDGAVVDIATLELRCSSVSETYTVSAHYCSDNSWNQLSLTYSNSPGFNATAMDTVAVASSFQWYSWDVGFAVRKGLNGIYGGPDVVTIVLRETVNRGILSFVSFSSSEVFGGEPELTIHWTHIVPEFSSPLTLSLFLVTLLIGALVFRKTRRQME